MSTERLKLMGHLEEVRLSAERTKLKLVGLRDSIREILDRYEPIETIRADVAASQALELATHQVIYREQLEQIAAIRRDLGMEE